MDYRAVLADQDGVLRAKVADFTAEKGFGFLRHEKFLETFGRELIFFHTNDMDDKEPDLREGDEVTYETIVPDQKQKPMASRVQAVNQRPSKSMRSAHFSNVPYRITSENELCNYFRSGGFSGEIESVRLFRTPDGQRSRGMGVIVLKDAVT